MIAEKEIERKKGELPCNRHWHRLYRDCRQDGVGARHERWPSLEKFAQSAQVRRLVVCGRG